MVSFRILQSPGKSPHTCPSRKHARYRTNTNGALTSPMDLDDELPRIHHKGSWNASGTLWQ